MRATLGLALPTAFYYACRGFGASVYLALVLSTLLSAVPTLSSLVRHRRVDGLSTYFTAMMLGGLVVATVPGGTRFLLAREAVLTAVTGVWFIASTWRGQPLAYQFTKPLLEGRFRWPDDWDELWPQSELFRRMWRNASLIFGLGLLADAGLRVLLACTVRPDLVPALALVLYIATVVFLNVVVNIYFVLCRVHDPRSELRRGDSLTPR